VMENAGLRREAEEILARWNRVDEKWADQYKYAILAEEYEMLSDGIEEGKR
ncbi:MAG: hypothetical protein GX763_05790, partial [Clostridiaceae bacterium]|nr:hypothetical protein [Clostridiaceae bacterium]